MIEENNPLIPTLTIDAKNSDINDMMINTEINRLK